MRALLVEDDTSAAKSIATMLKDEGFATDIALDGAEGVEFGKLYEYDIIVLDLKLPDMSGHGVLDVLRKSKNPAPVLILSGLGDVANKVRGLGTGADDYLTKPFDRAEFIARVRAIIRRTHGHAQPGIQIGKLDIDLSARAVAVDGTPVRLTNKEYQIFEILCLRKGMTITKEMFLDHLYGGMDEPEAKIIDVFVCKLRRKLAEATGGAHYIETIWGRGYVLREPPAARVSSVRASAVA